MIWLALGSILTLFVLFALTRQTIHKALGLKVCAICAAVSLTWLGLLGASYAGLGIDTLLLGILMGESVTGLMYLFEEKALAAKRKDLLWLKVVIILLGTAVVYFLLTQGFSFGSLLVIALFMGFVVYTTLKGKKSNAMVKNRYGKYSKEIKALEERLEHCCD